MAEVLAAKYQLFHKTICTHGSATAAFAKGIHQAVTFLRS
jgi:hypothetical protein